MDIKVKYAQMYLNRLGHNAGTEDGLMGRKTRSALDKLGLPSSWSEKRKILAAVQLFCKDMGFDAGVVDGLWGPKTEQAIEDLEEKLNGTIVKWRDNEPDLNIASVWPKQKDVEKYFGKVGQNQTKIKVPYPHKISWDTSKTINSFSCHEKVHDSLERVLKRVLSHYGIAKIQKLGLDLWGGCLCVRKIRGGSNYSMHSWGIALDYDPANNQLKWKKNKAKFAKPEYDEWWKIWEDEGWLSLGRKRDYDWMHVQAATF